MKKKDAEDEAWDLIDEYEKRFGNEMFLLTHSPCDTWEELRDLVQKCLDIGKSYEEQIAPVDYFLERYETVFQVKFLIAETHFSDEELKAIIQKCFAKKKPCEEINEEYRKIWLEKIKNDSTDDLIHQYCGKFRKAFPIEVMRSLSDKELKDTLINCLKNGKPYEFSEEIKRLMADPGFNF